MRELENASRLGVRLHVLALAVLFIFLAGDAAAGTYVVNRADDIPPRGTGSTCITPASTDCTLREAVIKSNANPGSVIQFAASTNGIAITLTLANAGGVDENAAATGDLDVTQDLTIQGNGETNTIIQAGTNTSNGIDKVFGFNPNCDHAVSVSVDGVTIRFGRNSQPTSDPLFSFTGGGLDFCGFGSGSFTLTNSTVSDNTNVSAYGGGINFDTVGASTGTITLTNVKILRNRTLSTTFTATGGGLNAFGEGYALNVTGTTFDANSADGTEGGGMYLRPTRHMVAAIHASTFSNNAAGSRGGGLVFNSPGDASNPVQSLTIDQGSSFTANTSGTRAGQAAEGGGIYVSLGNANSSFTLTKATVTGNGFGATSDKRGGGGVAVGGTAGPVVISFSRIVGNSIGAPDAGANQGTGLHKDNNPGTVTATNNWWGCSTGPSAAPCDTAVVSGGGSGGPGVVGSSPWLRDGLTAAAPTIVTNQSTSLTASFNTNSAGSSVAGNVDRLLGLPVSFSAVGGSISLAQGTVQPAGTATAAYTASAAGAGNRAAAVVDADGTTPPASNVLTITVNKAGTTTTISSAAPAPSVTGQGVSVSFGVVGAFGNAPTAPVGNVTVTDGAVSCTAPAAAGSCILTPTTAGTKSFVASYAGDANFVGSASLPFSHVVNKADTTTTVVSSLPGPSVPGQVVTVSASVAVTSPGAGIPTGTISVTDGVDGCVIALPAPSCTVTPATVGTRPFVATYSGDASFNGSVSAGFSHTVNKAGTTTVLTTALPDPSVVGQAVTASFTLTVNPPSSGAPTGTVSVTDGVDTCVAALPAASCVLGLSTPGARTLTAAFAGDASFDTSTSAGIGHTVNAAPTTTTVTNAAALGATPTVVGEAFAVSYAVVAAAPGAGAPAGSVTVSDGAASCTGTVAAGSCSLVLTSAGARTLTATYAGNASFATSSSGGAPHTVNPAATTTTITADTPDPSSVGQAVAVAFSVAVSAPGAGIPTGNVTVTDGAVSCTAAVAAGTCSLTFTSVGARSLAATYAGDSNFGGSASPGVPHDVVAAGTTTTITNAASLSATPTVVGQALSVSFAVAPVPPAGGAPTGSVTVGDGVDSCTASVGAGACSLALVTPGARTLVATYAGDADFGGSASAGAAHFVNAAGTTATVVSVLPDPSAAGQSVTATFTVTVTPPGSGTPTGSVTVGDGVDSCTASVAAGSCTLTLGTAGARTLVATYAGDASFAGASSPGLSHSVTAALTALTASATPASAPVGGLLRASATLSGGAAPTGSILFELFSPGSGTPAFTETVPVTSGNGTYSTAGSFAATQLGAWQWRATYGGDANNSRQVSAPAVVTVRAVETVVPTVTPFGLALLALAMAAAGAALARRGA